MLVFSLITRFEPPPFHVCCLATISDQGIFVSASMFRASGDICPVEKCGIFSYWMSELVPCRYDSNGRQGLAARKLIKMVKKFHCCCLFERSVFVRHPRQRFFFRNFPSDEKNIFIFFQIFRHQIIPFSAPDTRQVVEES